jgi:hypothetical protein
MGFGLLTIIACASSTTPSGSAVSDTVLTDPSYAADIQPIWTASCTGCHGSGGDAGLNLSSGSSYAHLVNVASTQDHTRMLVLPGDATNSWLVMKLENRQTVGGKMPPSGSLTANQIQNIKNWITQGAKNN